MIQVYMNVKTKKLLLVSLAGGLLSGMLLAGTLFLAMNSNTRVFDRIGGQSSSNAFALAQAQETAVVNAVNKATPAVVSISATRELPIIERRINSNGFFEFYDDGFTYNNSEKVEVGGGSGFFISSDGYIVTNKHVVEDEYADYIVSTNEGEEYSAKVVFKDAELDVAILKVEGKGFSYLKIGNSDKVEIGQTVIAIGNALGEFRNTVSVGIVSGLERSIVAGDMLGRSESLSRLIQTDAAINHGNSGGPLLDMRGNVIGINVAVASMAQNISFALPANDIKTIVDSVRK